jgi:hypothetical protein
MEHSDDYKEPGRTVKGVCWVYTHHEHDDCDNFPRECVEVAPKRSDGASANIVCGGYGKEMGKDGVTPHVQGWFALDDELIFGTIKANFCDKIHYEKMRGSIEDSEKYCSKEGEYVSFGERDGVQNPHARGGQGARNDHENMLKKLKTGKRKAELWDSDFGYMIRHHRGVNEYLSVTAKPVAAEQIHVLWGVAGSGKTGTAMKMINDLEYSFYEPDENNSGKISFESYDAQNVLLLNDFSSDSLGVCTLKRILDPRHGAMLPGRGRSLPNQAKMIIITSNYNPRSWYKEEEWRALERRFTSLTYCGMEQWTNELTGETFDSPWKQHLAAMAAAEVEAAVM